MAHIENSKIPAEICADDGIGRVSDRHTRGVAFGTGSEKKISRDERQGILSCVPIRGALTARALQARSQ